MRMSRAKVVGSTVYPGMKSIQSLKTILSEDWFEVFYAEAKGIREIFDPFKVGEEIVIIPALDYDDLLKELEECRKAWEDFTDALDEIGGEEE